MHDALPSYRHGVPQLNRSIHSHYEPCYSHSLGYVELLTQLEEVYLHRPKAECVAIVAMLVGSHVAQWLWTYMKRQLTGCSYEWTKEVRSKSLQVYVHSTHMCHYRKSINGLGTLCVTRILLAPKIPLSTLWMVQDVNFPIWWWEVVNSVAL